LPAVTAELGVSFTLVTVDECTDTCCTNAGGAPSADAPADIMAHASRLLAANTVTTEMVSLPRICRPRPFVLAHCRRYRHICRLPIYVLTAADRAFRAMNSAFNA
jgi:hypothetical protein